MKNVCWALFGLSVLAFLLGMASKISGPGAWILGFEPVAWWRAAMALLFYAIGLKVLSGDGRLAA